MPIALTIIYLAALLVGLLVGSVITQVAWRLPRILEAAFVRAEARESNTPAPDWTLARYALFRPRAACTSCGHPLALKDRAPVLSYLLLRGRCRTCGTRIGLWYLSVEATTAAIALLCVCRFGYTPAGISVFLGSAFLLTIAVIDMMSMIIPDSLTAFVTILGVVANWLWLPLGWQASLIGAASGLVGLWAAATGYRLMFGREGLGFGDVKLVGALGAWVGTAALPLLAILAGVVFLGAALLWRAGKAEHRSVETELPFGPALVFAGLALVLAPSASVTILRITH